MAVSEVNPPLLDAVMRMVRLMETPREAAVLAPLIEREILYRMLLGDQGPRLAQIARADGRMRQVRRAIGWIKQHFDQHFSIEDLAAEARMSPSALHRHFKAVTALSPLQYQKQIRLQEARKLILVQRLDAGSAGHAVGYDSASQFSREYARLFGAPPLRDVARLRSRPDMLVDS
jgi:transcriptional regulator GlxA family with amidase domain